MGESLRFTISHDLPSMPNPRLSFGYTTESKGLAGIGLINGVILGREAFGKLPNYTGTDSYFLPGPYQYVNGDFIWDSEGVPGIAFPNVSEQFVIEIMATANTASAVGKVSYVNFYDFQLVPEPTGIASVSDRLWNPVFET